MALPKATPLRVGVLKGTIYEFMAVGDALPEHSHDAHNCHITIIQLGRIAARGYWLTPEGEKVRHWERILDPTVPGARIIPLVPDQIHTLVALEAGSIAINIVYGSALTPREKEDLDAISDPRPATLSEGDGPLQRCTGWY